jgi:hypothetical protein
MSAIQCPHCHTAVPTGATVCTGCHGEVVYGIPTEVRKALMIVGGLVGAYGGWTLFKLFIGPTRSNPEYGIGVSFLAVGALVAIVGLFVLVGKFYRGHATVYKRYNAST